VTARRIVVREAPLTPQDLGGVMRDAVAGDRPCWLGANDGLIFPGSMLIGSLLGANFQSTADQAIPIASSNYVLREILVVNPVGTFGLAAGGFYTAASKGGVALVSAAQLYTALAAVSSVLGLLLATKVPSRRCFLA
jgi:hypothetical protein